MKVILLRDVAKIGKRNQIVDVPDGYAINQLIPKKWAEAASAQNLKRITAANAVKDAHATAAIKRFDEAVERFRVTPLKIAAEPNAQGHLFKAIHESDIVATAKESGVSLEREWISINSPIKAIGVHEITLKGPGKVATIGIEIIKK